LERFDKDQQQGETAMKIGLKKMINEGEERLVQLMKNVWLKTWVFQL
jgi:hypothetical protein